MRALIFELDGWKIHRPTGMGGGLFTCAVLRAIGKPSGDDDRQPELAPRPSIRMPTQSVGVDR